MRHTKPILAALLATTSLMSSANAYIFYECEQSTSLTGPTLVTDINPGAASAAQILFGYSQPREHMIAYDGDLYFQANNGQAGAELWRIGPNGIPAMVEDLAGGSAGSSPHSFARTLPPPFGDGKLYFAATTPNTGEELFFYDGTKISLAVDTVPGSEGAEISGLTYYQGAIYFIRQTPEDGRKVWRYDGVNATPVYAINLSGIGRVHSGGTGTEDFTVFNGRLYYVANRLVDGVLHAYELWSFDGKSPRFIKQLTPDDDASSRDFGLGVYDGQLYFGAVVAGPNLTEKSQLWKYSGLGFPIKVMDIPTPNSPYFSNPPTEFELFDGKLYFQKSSDLFRIDTNGVQNLSNASAAIPLVPRGLTSFETGATKRLYYTGFESIWDESEPYVFNDGTTTMLANIKPDSASTPGSFPTRGVQAHDRLYFYADDGSSGREIWSFGVDPLAPIKCHVVAAPIWDNWLEWPMDERDLFVETYYLTPRSQPSRVLSQEVTMRRNSPSALEAMSISQRTGLPDAYGFYTTVTDRATGELVEREFEIIGVPTAREIDELNAQALDLEGRR